MSDTHLSVRISSELADSLERLAQSKGTPRSSVVREAVSQYVGGGAPRAEAPRLLARDFKREWDALPHLTAEEASALDTDICQARSMLAPPDDPWD